MRMFDGRRVRRAALAAGIAGVAALSAGVTGAVGFTEPGLTNSPQDFANCPMSTIHTEGGCLHSYTTGGYVQLGRSIVPISVPGDTFDVGFQITEDQGFQAAMCEPFGPFVEVQEGCVFVPGAGVLNGPAQPVPSGLLGTIGNVRLTGVTSKLEWAAPLVAHTAFGGFAGEVEPPGAVLNEAHLIGETGPGLRLSIKLHLISPFFGANCYIGSAANPIVIVLTTGATSPPPPTAPMHGALTSIAFKNNFLLELGFRMVGDSFSVPVATGCGTTGGGLVDAAIDRRLGLPSAAGHNAIVLNVIAEQATVAGVEDLSVFGN